MHSGATSTPGMGTTIAACVVVVRGVVVGADEVGGAVVGVGVGFGAAVAGVVAFGGAVVVAFGAAVVVAFGAFGAAVAGVVAAGAAVAGVGAFGAAVVGESAGGDVVIGGAAVLGDVAGSAGGAVLPTSPLRPNAAPEERRATTPGAAVDAVSGDGELTAPGSAVGSDGVGTDAGDAVGASEPAALVVAPVLWRGAVGRASADPARLAASPPGCSPRGCGSCALASDSPPPLSTATAQISSATAAQI
jgi:hypothetical protein